MDYELVLIRPDELFLKSDPVMRNMMERLAHNVKTALASKDVVYDSISRDRLFISVKSPEAEEVVEACKYIPGISVIMPAVIVGKEMSAIKRAALDLFVTAKSFAVRAKRSSKDFNYSSKDIEKEVGTFILKNKKTKVNLDNPEKTVYVEIMDNEALISSSKVMGIGGLPVGVSGKVLCAVEKEDDLLAAYLLLKRGCEIHLALFDEKLRNKMNYLDKFSFGSLVKISAESRKFSWEKLGELAKKVGAKAICTGWTDLDKKELISGVLAFTPLAGLGKAEIEKLKKIIFKKG